MSIRSVDMMILYSKTADVERAQQAEQQQGRVAQQQISAEEIKSKDVKQTQVQQSPRGDEGGRIHEHPERKRGKRTGTRGRGEERDEGELENGEEQTQKKFRVSPHGGSIDIRI